MLYTQNYLSSDVYTKFQNYINSELYTKFSLGSGGKKKESLLVNRSNPYVMDGCHTINATYRKSKVMTNSYKNATLKSSPNKSNVIVSNDMLKRGSLISTEENISNDYFQQRSSLSNYTLIYERIYCHLISGVGRGKVTKEPSEVMHLTFGLVTVIYGSNATFIFPCLVADGSNASVVDSCCCIHSTFVYDLMCYRYHELLLKNTMLESSPRIGRHNIEAYNHNSMFESDLPLSKYSLCFESMYYFHSGIVKCTKCFLSNSVGFPKFSLGSGGKGAENTTELINLNMELFVFWNLPQSIHMTTLKPKLIESANRDNNGTSEGDTPPKPNSIYVHLMLTSFILVCCILRIMSWVRTAYITMY